MYGLFGTDGVRGLANSEITPEVATRLARAAAARTPRQTTRPQFLVAKDTRLSADLLEAAVAAGLCSGGADALLGGIMPTPAAAHAVKKFDLQGAIVVSASHNTYPLTTPTSTTASSSSAPGAANSPNRPNGR
jgi:phosphoglucosamine mutase